MIMILNSQFYSGRAPIIETNMVIGLTGSEISENKKLFVKIRDLMNKLDSQLSIILGTRNMATIYSAMVNIYVLAISSKKQETQTFANILVFCTMASIVELIVSCFICGCVHQKSQQIHKTLDKINSNDLSESEYKEWLMFKTITSEGSFGFTIGGFASLKKTTLIPVSNHWIL